MLIYMATNKVNGKMYIGQTIRSLKLRIKDHINKALNKQNNMYIGRAIREYGKDNFEWIILHDDITNIDLLNRLEIFYIGYYDTFLGDGYNCTAGGYGSLPSEDTRKQLSISAKNKPPVSDEFRKKMSKITKGRIVSDKTKEKMSKAGKGRIVSTETKKKISETRIKKGIKPSIEARKKMSETSKGRTWPEDQKRKVSGVNSIHAVPVIINDKYFGTIENAAKYLNIHRDTVSRKLKNQKPGYQYACQKEI